MVDLLKTDVAAAFKIVQIHAIKLFRVNEWIMCCIKSSNLIAYTHECLRTYTSICYTFFTRSISMQKRIKIIIIDCMKYMEYFWERNAIKFYEFIRFLVKAQKAALCVRFRRNAFQYKIYYFWCRYGINEMTNFSAKFWALPLSQ